MVPVGEKVEKLAEVYRHKQRLIMTAKTSAMMNAVCTD